MIDRTLSNDAYGYTGDVNVNRGYAVNGLNQYTAAGARTLGHDANGNLASDAPATAPTAANTSTYAYDAENRLTSASGLATATLAYDPLGRLFSSMGAAAASETRYLYDGDALVAEYTAAGVLLRRYAHGPGVDEPLLWYDGAGASARHLLANHQGSIIAVADNFGTSLAINAYDAYGIPAAGNLGRFQYTGQIWLAELGMYHYKARVYSPTLGRFLQTDPIGYDDQINLYAYVGNDPVNAVDPSGMQACPDDPESQCPTASKYPKDLPEDFVQKETKQSVPEPTRQKEEPHYKVKDFAFCSADDLFAQFSKPGNSAPGAPAAQPGTTPDIVLTDGNPITQIVNRSARTITNVTQKGHRYHSGTVEIITTPTWYGSTVSIEGRGTTSRYWENSILGKILFTALSTRATIACTIGVK